MATLTGIALVTGGSRGIGRAIVERLAADGYWVFFTYVRNEAMAAEVVESVAKGGGRARSFRCDLGSLSDMEVLFSAIDAETQPLRVVVNNAAVFHTGSLEDMTQEAFDETMALNMRAPAFLGRSAARRLQSGGRLIFISSVAARIASPGYIPYAMSKAALGALVRALAVELGPQGVTVNSVAPGMTETDMATRLTDAVQPGLAEGVIAATPLGRIGQPSDIAGAVSLLARPEAGWITGQSIECSGGYML